jgi:hypothetical protein
MRYSFFFIAILLLYILEGYEILIIILKSRLKLNIIAGIFFIGVDIIEIFVPEYSTNPFLLISAALYKRCSKEFCNWIINNKIFSLKTPAKIYKYKYSSRTCFSGYLLIIELIMV